MQYSFVALFMIIALFFPSMLLSAPYYKGRVIKLVLGFPPGGGYDRMNRLMATHLPNHIPGKPSIVIQNMPGGDSIIAANYLYNVAKADGFTIGCLSKALVFAQLLRVKGIKFDVTKYRWLCSSSVDTTLFTIRSDLPYGTIQDLQKADKTIYVAGQGPTAFGTQLSNIVINFFKLNAKIVDYGSTAETVLAMERKEVDASAFAYNSARPFLKRGLIRSLVRTQMIQKGAENIPVHLDFISDKMGKTVAEMHGSVGRVGKSFLAPPGTPDHALKILRKAFADAIKDPALQADAQKSLQEVQYVSPEDCLKTITYILNQPPEVVTEFSRYVRF